MCVRIVCLYAPFGVRRPNGFWNWNDQTLKSDWGVRKFLLKMTGKAVDAQDDRPGYLPGWPRKALVSIKKNSALRNL